jgi:hypothetical protein
VNLTKVASKMNSNGDGNSGDAFLPPSDDASNATDDVEIISLPQPLALKRKRVKNKESMSVPEVDGTLTIVVHMITTTASGDFLTKSRKSYTFRIENAAVYVNNIDILDATKNTTSPSISASTAHGLVINHFGQMASDLLRRLSSGNEPYLVQRLKANSNPECSVSI